MPANAPDQIAFLRLDTDYYSSTKVELETMFPRLSPGSVLIVDDCGPVFFHRIDACARLMIKPGQAA